MDNQEVILKKSLYSMHFKRILDIIFSFLLLIILSPVMIIISILVKIKMGSPVIFCQDRPGLNEKIFKMYKFRTMTMKTDEKGELLSDEERLTKTGKFLRATSIDELPELFNILKGDMSFVGPRPLLVRYLKRYDEIQKHRHDVRPGLTGLAQVNGRNSISWKEKFEYDITYINKLSFLYDLKIVIKTFKNVLIRKGISSNTSATMEEFMGNEK